MRWTRVSQLLLLFAVCTQLLAAGALELTFDETYYLLWAKSPSWAYVDHPPLIAWLLVSVAGLGPIEWLSRLPVMLCGTLVLWSEAVLVRRTLGSTTSGITVAALACSIPLWWSSVVISPDGPLMAASAVALLLHARAVKHHRPLDWILVGVALGAALLSKYTALLLVVGLALHVAVYRPRFILQARTWWAPGVALFLFSPVLAWNARHGWASFLFQLNLGARHLDGESGWRTVADFVGGQLVWLGPCLAWGMGSALRFAWKNRHDSTVGMWMINGTLPLVVLLVTSSHQAVEANWASPAWLCWIPLISAARPRLALGSAFSLVGIVAGVALYLSHPWMDPGKDITTRFFGWRGLATEVDRCAQQAGLQHWYVQGDSRRETTQVHYYLGAHHDAFPAGEQPRFRFMDHSVLAGQGAVLLLDPADATVEQVQRMAHESHLQPLRACGVVPRQHVDGRTTESFALFALSPEL